VKQKLRVGTIPFINALPLVYNLENDMHVELLRLPPHTLSDMLVEGKIDAALTSVVTYFEHKFSYVDKVCIGGKDRVGSVMVFARKPLEEAKTIKLDTVSLASNEMLKLTLARLLPGKQFEFIEPGQRAPFGTMFDAELKIGDTALTLWGTYPYEYDLGELWVRATRLPAVFALWLYDPKIIDERGWTHYEFMTMIQTSKSRGIDNLPEIIRRSAKMLGQPERKMEKYFREMMAYYLGPAQEESIAKFHEWYLEAKGLKRPESGEKTFVTQAGGHADSPPPPSQRDAQPSPAPAGANPGSPPQRNGGQTPSPPAPEGVGERQDEPHTEPLF